MAPSAADAQPARAIAAAGLACMNSVTSGASENAAPAEAARCAATIHSCCRIHAEVPPRAANGPAPGNLDSDTARSIRASTASFSSLKSGPNPLAQHQNPPVRAELAGEMAELCAKRPCVSTRIHTISSGAVAKRKNREEECLAYLSRDQNSLLFLLVGARAGFPLQRSQDVPRFL